MQVVAACASVLKLVPTFPIVLFMQIALFVTAMSDASPPDIVPASTRFACQSMLSRPTTVFPSAYPASDYTRSCFESA